MPTLTGEFAMRKNLVPLACSTLILGLAAGAAGAANLTGTVTYTGKVPTLKPVAMDADPGCAAKHTTPVMSDVLVLGPGNTMANVMVRVKSGATGTFTAPAKPVVIDQKG